MDERIGWIGGRKEGWMDRRMDGRTGGLTMADNTCME